VNDAEALLERYLIGDFADEVNPVPGR